MYGVPLEVWVGYSDSEWSGREGTCSMEGVPSKVWVGYSISTVVMIGYVSSAVDVIIEPCLPFKSRDGSLKLSISHDIITEDMLGC